MPAEWNLNDIQYENISNRSTYGLNFLTLRKNNSDNNIYISRKFTTINKLIWVKVFPLLR